MLATVSGMGWKNVVLCSTIQDCNVWILIHVLWASRNSALTVDGASSDDEKSFISKRILKLLRERVAIHRRWTCCF